MLEGRDVSLIAVLYSPNSFTVHLPRKIGRKLEAGKDTPQIRDVTRVEQNTESQLCSSNHDSRSWEQRRISTCRLQNERVI